MNTKVKGHFQGHRVLGEIPLKDLTVIEKDIDKDSQKKGVESCAVPSHLPSCLISPTHSLPRPQLSSPAQRIRNRLVLLTATGSRYELEASDPSERDAWASYIRVASKLS